MKTPPPASVIPNLARGACGFFVIFAMMASPSHAGVIVYDSSVANWFEASGGLSAWSAVTNQEDAGSFLNVITPPTNSIVVQNTNASGTVLPSHYAGGIWFAPVGEVITSVTFTYNGIYGDWVTAPNLYAYAGVDNSSLNWIYDSSGIGQNGSNYTEDHTVTLTFSQADAYSVFEVRNWYLPAGGGSLYVAPNGGWSSTVKSVAITTAAVPEPGTLSLMALSVGFVIYRVRRFACSGGVA